MSGGTMAQAGGMNMPVPVPNPAMAVNQVSLFLPPSLRPSFAEWRRLYGGPPRAPLVSSGGAPPHPVNQAASVSQQQAVRLSQLEAERQQNLMKIQQLQQTLEAAQAKELQYKAAAQEQQTMLERQRVVNHQVQQGHTKNSHYSSCGASGLLGFSQKGLFTNCACCGSNSSLFSFQLQQQQQQQQRFQAGQNSNLRHILQQQMRQQQMLMQQQQQQNQQQQSTIRAQLAASGGMVTAMGGPQGGPPGGGPPQGPPQQPQGGGAPGWDDTALLDLLGGGPHNG
ncbi:unnamed protein product [Ixodes persulcatus]